MWISPSSMCRNCESAVDRLVPQGVRRALSANLRFLKGLNVHMGRLANAGVAAAISLRALSPQEALAS